MGRPPLRLGRPKGRPQAPFQPSHENRYPFTNWSTFAPPKWSKFTPPLTADGLTALFGDLEVAFLPMSRVRSFDDRRGDDERRTWNLQRYRYGLWLAFSRTTGAGKFDPYPLTLSKRIKTTEALMGEVL